MLVVMWVDVGRENECLNDARGKEMRNGYVDVILEG